MSTLHTVNKPSWNSDLLASCLRVARAGDSILLIEDGAYNVTTLNDVAARTNVLLDALHCFVLEDDLHARGIDQSAVPDFMTLVNHKGFVALACEHRQSVHWF